MIQRLFEKERKSGFLVNITKIVIICFVGLCLIGFFFPFYEYPNDSRGYGLHSIRLSNGDYEYTNELLESTGKWEYVPGSQVLTEHNSSIPDSIDFNCDNGNSVNSRLFSSANLTIFPLRLYASLKV